MAARCGEIICYDPVPLAEVPADVHRTCCQITVGKCGRCQEVSSYMHLIACIYHVQVAVSCFIYFMPFLKVWALSRKVIVPSDVQLPGVHCHRSSLLVQGPCHFQVSSPKVDITCRDQVSINDHLMAAEIHTPEINITFNVCVILQSQPADAVVICIFKSDTVGIFFCQVDIAWSTRIKCSDALLRINLFDISLNIDCSCSQDVIVGSWLYD